MTGKTVRIALAGNPNVGKTSLFNRLTGSNQHVGNWPGVTVERIEGETLHTDTRIEIVDLPGTYSISAYSEDERIARDHILRERPDLVVQVVDATNLERNLFLTLQLLELGAPVMIALNKWDLVLKRGDRIDHGYLSDLIKVKVVPTVGSSGKGLEKLKDSMAHPEDQIIKMTNTIDYGRKTEELIDRITLLLDDAGEILGPYPKRWLAVKLIEGDNEILELSKGSKLHSSLEKALEGVDHEVLELAMTDARYDLASRIARTVTTSKPRKRSITDRLDQVLTNKYLGIPIFLVMG